jgi:hypothetical protein
MLATEAWAQRPFLEGIVQRRSNFERTRFPIAAYLVFLSRPPLRAACREDQATLRARNQTFVVMPQGIVTHTMRILRALGAIQDR